EVKDVNEAGDTTLTQTTESSQFTLNGQEQPTDPAALTTTTQTVSKTGLILKQSVANGQPEWTKVYEISSMLTVTPAPTQPVKIGDTWKTEMDNRVVEGKKVTVTSTLVGKEKVAGMDALKVRIKMEIPPTADAADSDTIKSEGTYFVEPQ